jgi:hypothetical protein
MWLGIAIAPLTLAHATARSMIEAAEPIAIPVLRVLVVAALIVSYPYWWAQGAALADQVTHMILSLPTVTDGLQKLMDYAVDGVALGGWQLIDLGLMAAIAIELLGLIFLKVTLILLGALLYATGPLMIGLVPTRFGHTIARGWLSAVMFLLGIGIGWATIFAVGALLIGDAGTAGPLIAGDSSFGQLIGGMILAVAGLASLWLCLKVAREAGGMLRMQLGGMLALGHGSGMTAGRASSAASARERTSSSSLRSFGGQLAAGTRSAGGELAGAVPGGRQMRLAMSGTRHVGRHGLVGTAATGARAAAGKGSAPAAALLGRTRAGAVAVQMARAGTAGWNQPNRPSAAAREAKPSPATPPRAPKGTRPAATSAAAPGAGRKSSNRAARTSSANVSGAGASVTQRNDRGRLRPATGSRSASDGPPAQSTPAVTDRGRRVPAGAPEGQPRVPGAAATGIGGGQATANVGTGRTLHGVTPSPQRSRRKPRPSASSEPTDGQTPAPRPSRSPSSLRRTDSPPEPRVKTTPPPPAPQPKPRTEDSGSPTRDGSRR